MDVLDFLASIDTNRCTEWPYGTTDGYGMVQVALDHYRRTHAVVCEKFHGEQPSDEMEVAHSCGNRLCVNPRHLRWADRQENITDAIGHGTRRYREDVVTSVLTEKLVAEARRRYRSGDSFDTIARDYDVSTTTIRNAVRGFTWTGDVLDESPMLVRSERPQGGVTVAEAAEIAGVSRQAIYRAIGRGDMNRTDGWLQRQDVDGYAQGRAA